MIHMVKKKDIETFNLNVRFSYASKVPKNEGKARIKKWIDEAERLFNDKPKLKIDTEYKWNIKTDNNPTFKNSRELRRFMDNNFDNIVGADKTEGCLQVLVVDSITIGKNNSKITLFGSSFFPHCVTPFGRKHGIIMDIDALNSTFAHELGHMFSLKHTFEKYVGFKNNCNKDFPKGEDGKGGTRKGKTINLMDYNRKDSDKVWLNECQKERAAKQRRLYLTRKGEVNYRKLKGLR